jgi:hypothetical protein
MSRRVSPDLLDHVDKAARHLQNAIAELTHAVSLANTTLAGPPLIDPLALDLRRVGRARRGLLALLHVHGAKEPPP